VTSFLGFRLSQALLDVFLLNALYAYSAYLGRLSGGFVLTYVGFIGLGAYAAAILDTRLGAPLQLSLLAAVLVCCLCAVLLARPLQRLAGVYLGIVSISFVGALQIIAVNWSSLTGGAFGVAGLNNVVQTPHLAVALVLVVLLIAVVDSSTAGLLLRLRIKDALLARTLGLRGPRVWALMFILSAALAGLAGGLRASWFGFVGPDDISFNQVVLILAMVILGGSEHWSGPLIGAAVFTVLPAALRGFGTWSDIATGLLLLVIVVGAPEGIAGRVRRLLIRRSAHRQRPSASVLAIEAAQSPPEAHEDKGVPDGKPAPMVEAKGISWQIDALKVLQKVDLSLWPGEICALVGPNGSGKSSLLNILSGVVPPNQGVVTVRSRDFTGRPAQEFFRAGVVRTFQEVRVIESETALANVRAATWYGAPDGGFPGVFLPTPARRRRLKSLQSESKAALALAGAAEFGPWLAADLSYGTRRKVELARALVAKPAVLLLDEPTAGVSQDHTQLMIDLIRREAATGCAVLIIDHDLEVIGGLCDRVVVLDAGIKIFEGPPAAAFADEAVRMAYIGA
jgi:ABC-type branched-subunit amino acid transport system ATPase component/ABC-type branched-subunit amino acid transport system permease subunit